MRDSWNEPLDRWVRADLIDLATAERIRAFEATLGPRSISVPIALALVFGALMVAAGVLLFVSSHWDALSPASRFALVLSAVAALHLGGAATTSPALREALHVGGTIALGGAIFLAAQIFNLEERWSTGVLLWAIGAAAGWALLRDNAQMVITALLAPAWLVSEWSVITAGDIVSGTRVASVGLFLLATAYLTAEDATVTTHRARAIRRIGAIAFLPAGVVLFAAAGGFDSGARGYSSVARGWLVAGWAVALALPMLIAVLLRGRGAVANALVLAWALVAISIPGAGVPNAAAALGWNVVARAALYAWFAAGAIALAAWGVREARPERINFGAAALAFTVLAFYFSQVMDRLGRSASLIVFGILFLAGGWLLERTRRGLVVQARTGGS